MSAAGLLLVLTGASGTGKSSVVGELLGLEAGLRFSVSHTTRPRREGEREGLDYHFVTPGEFEALRAGGEFVEHAVVHGHLYGTSHAELQAAVLRGAELLLDIDVQGARQIAAKYPEAVTVFILPPDYASLERRLRGRKTESAESLDRRLRTAASEVRHYTTFRYVVVNETINAAATEIRAILAAERARTPRRQETVERIIATFPGGEDAGNSSI